MFLLVKIHHKQRVTLKFVCFLALQLVLLRMSQGTGAMITALIPVSYLAFIDRKHPFKKRLPLGYLFIVASIGFLVFALTVIQWVAPIIESLGKDATLSGRTVIWNKVIQVMQETHTMTGFGYNHFWEDPEALAIIHRGFSYKESWFATMSFGAHNNLMELWVNVGLLGIGAFFVALIASLRKPERWSQEQYIFIAGFMILLMIYGFTETSFTTYGFMTFFMFLAMGYACKDEKDDETAIFR